MSLMNELRITCGSLQLNGTIAYVSQESWVFNANVKQNIIFDKQYNKKRFREVVSVCAMERDLQSLPFREKTLVGERGVLLSGGQKARVALARYVIHYGLCLALNANIN